jgi:Trypsin
MNGANMLGYFKIIRFAIIRFALVLLQSSTGGLGKRLALLLGTALPVPALALVGPAREAPEFAPYVVMVMTRSSGGTNFCTASVIARDIVLTAAHCVTDIPGTRVFFRSNQSKLVMFEVASIARHPGYKPNAGRKHRISIDLALVRLVEPLPSGFKPLELAQLDRVATGQPFRIIGFGRASEEVSGTSGVLRTGVLVVSGPKSPVLTWLVDPHGTGLGGCTGDSGAPILTVDQPVLVAVAIQAKGNYGYSCGAMTEAVLIAPQLPWIRETFYSWGAAWSIAQ